MRVRGDLSKNDSPNKHMRIIANEEDADTIGIFFTLTD